MFLKAEKAKRLRAKDEVKKDALKRGAHGAPQNSARMRCHIFRPR